MPLKTLTPHFEEPYKETICRSARLTIERKPTSINSISEIRTKSLEVFRKSYRGRIPDIWDKLNSESFKNKQSNWKTCRKHLQKELVSNMHELSVNCSITL